MDRSSSGVDVDAIINTLWGSFHLYGPKSGAILEPMVEQVCRASRDIFLNQPCLLRLQPPITIAGNFYGEYTKLSSILGCNGFPPRSNYLFLGNYVDNQGRFLHTILLLLALKIKYPENIFLLRGDLDHAGVRPGVGVDELDGMSFISSSSMNILNDCLKFLPVAALISDKIICTHGGLSPDLHNLDQIKPRSPLLDDLIGTRSRSPGHFLEAKEAEFLEKHDLLLVCCGGRHQAVSRYRDFVERRVVFVSSSFGRPGLYDTYKNCDRDNTVMRVNVNLKCTFHNLRYNKKLWSFQILMADTTQDVCSSGFNPRFGKVGGSKAVNNPSKFELDPTGLYRSKSPGVKRFLGARV